MRDENKNAFFYSEFKIIFLTNQIRRIIFIDKDKDKKQFFNFILTLITC